MVMRTSTGEGLDAPASYGGELAPRSGWVGFLLTLLCPGLGSAYVGGVVGAVVINVVFVSLCASFVAVWTVHRFDPLLPGWMLAAQWMIVQGMLAVDFGLAARRAGASYVQRDSNHWVIYGSVFLFSYALPLLALQQFTATNLWPVHSVSDDAMAPTLLPGDRVLVDAMWPRANPWRRGDLVAYHPSGLGQEVRFGRVLGLPGDEIVLSEGRFFVNDSPVVHSLPTPETLQRLHDVAGPPPDAMQWNVEVAFGRAWAVGVPVVEAWGDATSWRVARDHLFVVHDHRIRDRDARTIGGVPLDAVVGRPHLVAYHVDEAMGWLDRVPYGLRGVAWKLASDADSRGAARSRLLVQASPVR
jgi:signal peptidase I